MAFPTVFSQVIQLIPRNEFESIVNRHAGDARTRSLNCWTWFGALLFGQLSGHDSIRAIERVFADTVFVNDRSEFWKASFPLFGLYRPIGFGPGGFVPAFYNIEPSTMLGAPYLNRLHNDWLETALTFGVPGILFLACRFEPCCGLSK